MTGPIPREAVFDTYWKFAAERNAIFLKRVRGEQQPWTDDPILQRFKFCNTFRAADRVSQYLIREVIYSDAGERCSAEDLFLRIVLFRLFSKERTWEALEDATGGVNRRTFVPSVLGDLLEDIRPSGPIYTSAFILADVPTFGQKAKHRNHLALVDSMFRTGGLGYAIRRARSLGEVFAALIDYPGIGPFLAYQIAIDLNYSDRLDFDEDEFTIPGPGAVRGIAKVFTNTGGESAGNLILGMVRDQEEEFARLDLSFEGLFGRPLKALDCQGLFCETDKYSREAFPELASNRSKIKQVFVPSPDPLPLFFPPKWGINDRVERETGGDPIPPGAPQLSLGGPA